jgi:hypothetical protein
MKENDELCDIGGQIAGATADFKIYEDGWTKSLKQRLEHLDERIKAHNATLD